MKWCMTLYNATFECSKRKKCKCTAKAKAVLHISASHTKLRWMIQIDDASLLAFPLVFATQCNGSPGLQCKNKWHITYCTFNSKRPSTAGWLCSVQDPEKMVLKGKLWLFQNYHSKNGKQWQIWNESSFILMQKHHNISSCLHWSVTHEKKTCA